MGMDNEQKMDRILEGESQTVPENNWGALWARN
jgi:hypothetical protein